jgi:hypothetical protein
LLTAISQICVYPAQGAGIDENATTLRLKLLPVGYWKTTSVIKQNEFALWRREQRRSSS